MARRADPGLRSYWHQLLEDQAASGKSVQAFCLKHNVSTASFYSWRRRLGSEALPSKSVAVSASKKTTPSSFVAIDLPVMQEVPATHCEVLLVDGRRVRVPPQYDRKSLQELFEALKETS